MWSEQSFLGLCVFWPKNTWRLLSTHINCHKQMYVKSCLTQISSLFLATISQCYTQTCPLWKLRSNGCFHRSMFFSFRLNKKKNLNQIFTFSLFNPFSLVVFRLAWDSNTILYKPWFHDASCISGGQSSRIKKRQCHLTMERTRKWTEWSIWPSFSTAVVCPPKRKLLQGERVHRHRFAF